MVVQETLRPEGQAALAAPLDRRLQLANRWMICARRVRMAGDMELADRLASISRRMLELGGVGALPIHAR